MYPRKTWRNVSISLRFFQLIPLVLLVLAFVQAREIILTDVETSFSPVGQLLATVLTALVVFMKTARAAKREYKAQWPRLDYKIKFGLQMVACIIVVRFIKLADRVKEVRRIVATFILPKELRRLT